MSSRAQESMAAPAGDSEMDVGRKGLARKLTCSVAAVIATGVLLIMAIQVGTTLTAVPEWGADVKDAMISLEQENIAKLATDKAEYVTEVFRRVKNGLLDIEDFAARVLMFPPETLVIDNDLEPFSGLQYFEDDESTWEHSTWFINDIISSTDFPEDGSSLDGLLNRSALMDVAFRGLQRQESLMYLAALDDPSVATGYSRVNMQAYPGFDMELAGYAEWEISQECDDRFTYYSTSDPDTYDPRCRAWYQDAAESGTRTVIFTNPYKDVGSGDLTVTLAAPVYNTTETTSLLGVVGVDMDFSAIEASILGLRVIDDEGYAYLLAPSDDSRTNIGAEVAVHFNLETKGDVQNIIELEDDVDEDELKALMDDINERCNGSSTYEKGGDVWIVSWSHESASSAEGCAGGFAVVVTVPEGALLTVFSETEDLIRNVVVLASVIMGILVAGILCFAVMLAFSMSAAITKPVNQLVDVVRGLNRMDFSQQEISPWMVNDVSSPEVVGLMEAFQGMSTVVKFANMTLSSGNTDVALRNYEEALVLFKKLGNDRGVSIVNNNIGNVYTLQAHEVDERAAQQMKPGLRKKLTQEATQKYTNATTCYKIAIDDAVMLCAGAQQRAEGDIEGGVGHSDHTEDENSSPAALNLQLMNRKFNLALCLAARGGKGRPDGGCREPQAIDEARMIMRECLFLATERQDALGDERRVEYLIAIATLERDRGQSRQREATEALDEAESVIADYRGGGGGFNGTGAGGGGLARKAGDGEGQSSSSKHAPTAVLRQRVQVARGQQCIAFANNAVAAIYHFDQAIIDCGDDMDPSAVREALVALKAQALMGNGRHFSQALLRGLGIPTTVGGGGVSDESICQAIDSALERVERERGAAGGGGLGGGSNKLQVDLCFVMDCTGSMQRWINQSKEKLFDIIKQAKADVSNLELRVAYVGYRDFGDKKQYEGPYDFHTEEQLPSLLQKLEGITAYGGGDYPEDVAGGLHNAVDLSWRSPVRLCLLIADAPCHGSMYHGVRDNYPKGCPRGRDPVKLLYTLQYELGVDFYFIRITATTDRMINLFKRELAKLAAKNTSSSLEANKTKMVLKRARIKQGVNKEVEPKFVQHDLGSNDNRFLEAVVESVKVSAGLNLRVENY